MTESGVLGKEWGLQPRRPDDMSKPRSGEARRRQMPKAMCKWKKKDIEKDLKKLSALVDAPQFVCANCARVANDKKHLCKPVKLKG